VRKMTDEEVRRGLEEIRKDLSPSEIAEQVAQLLECLFGRIDRMQDTIDELVDLSNRE
jgi:ribosomal protein L29